MVSGQAAGYKPLWYVLITPVGGTGQDVSYYVSDGGQGGTVIDVTDATTDRTSTCTVSLWDHENLGLLTQFGVGAQTEIWSDTKQSASSVLQTATVTTTGISLPVKSWVSCSSTTLQTSTSMDGQTWTPFVAVGANGSIQSPPYRWIRVNSGSATVTYLSMPKRITGIVLQVQTGQDGPAIKTVQLSGNDYTTVLLNSLISVAYQNEAPDVIIKNILSTYFPTITSNNVQTGAPLIDYVQFFHKSAFDCFNQLSQITGWDWYVDQNKDFHWFNAANNLATVVLSSVGPGANIVKGSAQFTSDGSQLKNKITFYGGSYLSNPWAEYQTGDGQRKTFFTTYPIAAVPVVYVNGTQKIVGVDGTDVNRDFYYVIGKNYVRQDSSEAALASTDVLEVLYQYHVPLIEQAQVDDSIAKYGLFEYAMTDASVKDRTQARAMIQGQLQEYAYPKINGTLDTWEPTLASGQMVTVNVPDQGINNVAMKITQVEHQISATEYDITVTLQGQVTP